MALTVAGRALRFGACADCAPVSLRFAADVVAAVNPAPEAQDTILMAPFANAHDHARGVRPSALGAFDMPLELWLATMTNTPRCDPFLVVAAALGRQALGGCGSIMVHYTRPQDPARVAEELRVVARAASSVGVRVAIAPALRDINALGYAPDAAILAALPATARAAIEQRLLRAPATPADQVKLVEELADEMATHPLVTVQYGPYGLEWCSEPLLRLIAERSAITGRRVHMHLMESRIQREYLDHAFPQGPLHHLDEIGLLSPRLSVGHGVWLRPDEMELLAARGVTVSINTSSNLNIRSGIAPVAEMHRRGVALATGLDGFSLDDDDDAFRELRLNYMLHKGVALDEGLPLDALFRAACEGGRRAVTGHPAGDSLGVGAAADVMVIDRAALNADVVVESSDAAILSQRGTKAMLRQMIVAGHEVVRDGVLTTLDLPSVQAELDAQLRHATGGYLDWRDVAGQWRDVLRGFYAADQHRCG
ncbi:amidohydrolase family protein [Humitalea sp. 24SJ18S-53]|uniref:amidohydrolase family protein n=1 Tax=Humitalea sp. 24SJ18S-53 TaxID=3422307 RepID=UPI003D67FD41